MVARASSIPRRRGRAARDDFNVVTFAVTPIGTDFRGEIARTAQLRLLPPGLVLPPNVAPVPDFTLTPSAPTVLTNVVFDASPTTDDGATCGPRCTYSWDFGDGQSGFGIFVTHQFTQQGTFQVKLTATDARGAATLVAKTVTVTAGQAPSASFTFSPTSPLVNDQISSRRKARAPRPAGASCPTNGTSGPDARHRRDHQQGVQHAGHLHGDAYGHRQPRPQDGHATIGDGDGWHRADVRRSPSPTKSGDWAKRFPSPPRRRVRLPGASIVAYDWNFGSGRQGSGMTIKQGLRHRRAPTW